MKLKHNLFILAISLFSLLASMLALFVLPDTIPVHWNMVGEVDGYGSKYLLLFIGSLGLITYFLMPLTKRMDPLEKKIDEKIETYALMRDLMTGLMVGVNFVFLGASLIPSFDIASGMNIVLGVGFILMGNYMPRVPHNSYLGIKTKWTLSHEDNWRKTHRMGGYLFFICGLLMFVMGVVRYHHGMVFALMSLIVGCLLVTYYSYYLSKHGN